MSRASRVLAVLASGLVFVATSVAQESRREAGGRGRRAESRPAQVPPSGEPFVTEFAPFDGNIVLGRPAATSVVVSVLWNADLAANLTVTPAGGLDPAISRPLALKGGDPLHARIEGLRPDVRYEYVVSSAADGKRLLPTDGPGSFRTARPPGASFTFTMQADSHLDAGCSGDLYRRTLANVASDGPDFHFDLGDTFMTDKHPSRDSAARHYAAQRMYFGLIGHRTPWLMVLGNHDGESPDKDLDLSLWSHELRTKLFANPVPDAFYSGNGTPHPQAGLLQNYYAFTWGDALFVALDPYWSSTTSRGGRNPWGMTLGDVQYRWLATTLRRSSAKYKFVFIHQLTGSYHRAGRGGAEAAAFCEWGGRDLDGQEAFARRRPSWEAPIHRLLVDNGATAVFHGHDHFYARQEKDGVVYQLVPQPARPNDRFDHAEEYGYRDGDFIPSSGHLRVRVTPESATVEYVRAAVADGRRNAVVNGSVAAVYVLRPRRVGTGPR